METNYRVLFPLQRWIAAVAILVIVSPLCDDVGRIDVDDVHRRQYNTHVQMKIQRELRQIQNGCSTYVIEKTSFVKIKVDMRVVRELSYSGLPCTG